MFRLRRSQMSRQCRFSNVPVREFRFQNLPFPNCAGQNVPLRLNDWPICNESYTVSNGASILRMGYSPHSTATSACDGFN